MIWAILFRTRSLFTEQMFIVYKQKSAVCTGPAAVKTPGVLVDRTQVLMELARSGMMSRLQTPSITAFVFNGNKP
jgi:hypothetical protein